MEKLIRDSQMEELEKEYWIAILPTMTKVQKDKLAGILEAERIGIENLEMKYGKIMTDEEKVKFREMMIKELTA